MNRNYQRHLFVGQQISLSKSDRVITLFYWVMLLIIAASFFSVPAVLAAEFKSHTGWSECSRNAQKGCKDDACRKKACTECKYYAIDIRTPKNSPKLVTWFEQYCPAADVDALKKEYAASGRAK